MSQHNFLTTRPVDMSLNTEKINKFIQEKMPSIVESLKSIQNDYNWILNLFMKNALKN